MKIAGARMNDVPRASATSQWSSSPMRSTPYDGGENLTYSLRIRGVKKADALKAAPRWRHHRLSIS